MARIRGIQGCLSSTRESMQIAEGSTSGTGEDMVRIKGFQGCQREQKVQPSGIGEDVKCY